MNKKSLFVLLTMVMVAALSVGFTSCGSDDDDEGGGGGNHDVSSSAKHIVRGVWSDGEEIEEAIFDYDSQGRVVKKTETENYDGHTSKATTTYFYSGSTIISKTQGDWNDGEVHTYTLSDGLIMKDKESGSGGNHYTYSYTYNGEGYLTSQTFTDDSEDPFTGGIQFEWTNGNLTKYTKKYEDGEAYTISISYSNISWPKNWQFYWKGIDMDEALEPLGVWGKMPKYLPNKFVRTNSDGDIKNWTLDYTVEDGDITKIVYQSAGSTEIYTLEWE